MLIIIVVDIGHLIWDNKILCCQIPLLPCGYTILHLSRSNCIAQVHPYNVYSKW